MTVHHRREIEAPTAAPEAPKPAPPPVPRRPRLVRWLAWVVGVAAVFSVVVLIALGVESDTGKGFAESAAIGEISPYENPEVFGNAARTAGAQGVTRTIYENPELLGSGATYRAPVAVPGGASLAEIDRYENPEVHIAAVRLGLLPPTIGTLSPHANPEVVSSIGRFELAAMAPTLGSLSIYANPEVFSSIGRFELAAMAPTLGSLSIYANPEVFTHWWRINLLPPSGR